MINVDRKNKTITIIACYFGHKMGLGVYMENLFEYLLPHLISSGYHVNLITNKTIKEQIKIDTQIDIIHTKWLDRILYSKLYLLFILPFLPVIKKSKYLFFPFNPVVGPFSRNAIVVIHDLNEFAIERKYGFLKTLFRKKIVEWTLKNSKKIIAISHFTKQQIETYFPEIKNENKIQVIHNGIHFDRNSLLLSQAASRTPYLLIVGRIDPKAKKLYESVKIFNSYKTYHPDFRLKIVGTYNDFCKVEALEFLRYIEQFDSIDYLGYIEDNELDILYKEAYATLFFSEFEGFGFPLLEAFYRECPVITNTENLVNDELSSGLDIKVHQSEIENAEIVNEKINSAKYISKVQLKAVAESFSWKKSAELYYKAFNY
ncbi:MAG: glycosyltransferase [Dysgonamonadaceae bacterium]|jgi:hypothetical protein|nr:glycosyltransferase [Dysgonamonadaceae bacterium]